MDDTYKMIYQIGDGQFTLTGDFDWLKAQWGNLIHTNPGVKLVSFEIEE
jgi:hypothetical protein